MRTATPRRDVHPALRFEIISAYNGTCQYCAEATATEVDHIIPLSADGDDALPNMTAACGRCNRRKYKRILPDAVIGPLLEKAAELAPVIQAAFKTAVANGTSGAAVLRPLSLPCGLVEEVKDYRFAERIGTESEAIRRLIRLGLDAEQKRRAAA